MIVEQLYRQSPDEMTLMAEPEDLSSLYDLEYEANEDDAWYNVYIVLDATAQTLTVNHLCTPEYKVVFSAHDFETEAEVDEFVGRFRPISQQVQDHQCAELSIGTAVCAAHGTSDDDLRFYDAVIEAVNRQTHSFSDGEEECLCNFVLLWQHGRGRGTLTSNNVASICIEKPAAQLDPRISAFEMMAKKKITSMGSISPRRKSSASVENNLELFQNKPLMDSTLMPKTEDSGSIINYDGWTRQDEDMGPKPCNIDGLAARENHFYILISNLEKDLTSSYIEDFIYKHTTIHPHAFIFPRLMSDPFTRGAIMVDSQKKVQKIYEFLDNPNHLVVSSKGRPWVVAERALTGVIQKNIWNLIPMALDECESKRTTEYERTDGELQVVLSGTISHKRANQLRDLYREFIHHQSGLCKDLVEEEKKILRSCQPA